MFSMNSFRNKASRVLKQQTWFDWVDRNSSFQIKVLNHTVPKDNISFQINCTTAYPIPLMVTRKNLYRPTSYQKQSKQRHLSPVKRICVFEHSVMTNFNCAYPAIQRGQGSGFLSEGSSWFTACMSEQRRFWRDCADAQARLNLRCSHRR